MVLSFLPPLQKAMGESLELYTVVCLVQAQLSGSWLSSIRNSDVESLLWLKHSVS